MSDTEYPSWKEALFSDDKIANIRCAIKYVLWHIGYALLAVIGIILMAGAKLVDGVRGLLPERSGSTRSTPREPSRAAKAVESFLTDSRVKKAARVIGTGFVVLYLIGALGYALYLFLQLLIASPIATLGAVALVFGAAALVLGIWTFGVPILREWLSRGGRAVVQGANRAGKKAVETPGIRRIYGECPVHMDLEPKWFDNLFNR